MILEVLYVALIALVAIPTIRLLFTCRHERAVFKVVGPPIFIAEWEFPPIAVAGLMISSFTIGWLLCCLLRIIL